MARILVMDDDDVFRGAIRTVLQSAGYEVLEAADGAAGLRVYREQGADLVLVDIFMPERDGLEVVQDLRAAIPRPKIVAMSGGGRHKQLDALSAAAAFGAERTLRKPFAPHELLAEVRTLLEEGGPS